MRLSHGVKRLLKVVQFPEAAGNAKRTYNVKSNRVVCEN